MIQATCRDSGRWRLVEVFTALGILSLCATERPGWEVVATFNIAEEPDLRKPAGARAVLQLIDKEKPDLVVMAPPSGPWGPWSRRWLEDTELWEARRRDLPLWKLCRDVWELQTAAGRLVMLAHPDGSAAWRLDYLADRDGVCRATVCLCAFGLCDPETQRPYQGKTVVDVNDGVLARELMRLLPASTLRTSTCSRHC